MASRLDEAWLGYASRLLGDDDHIAACAAAGGSPEHPGVDAVDLRWPGYLGAGYRPGGVLCVANVHRDFASGGFGLDAAERLVSATRAWRDSAMSGEDYLAGVRTAYRAGLRAWTVGSRVGQALDGLGVTIDEITYTNAARCQFPEVPPAVPKAGAIKRKLVKLCVARFPIDDLVEMLQPAVVLFTSVDAYDASVSSIDGMGAATVAFHQWYGNLTRPLDLSGSVLAARTPLREWVPALKAAISA